MLDSYRGHLPLIDGAVEAVRRLAARYALGLASSSNRPLIDAVLLVAGLTPFFAATVSSEEVPRGKPSPDVYLEAARRLGVDARALRRSRGLARRHPFRKAAGMRVIAIPNPSIRRTTRRSRRRTSTIRALAELTPELVDPTD